MDGDDLALLQQTEVTPTRFAGRHQLLNQFDRFRREVDTAQVGGMEDVYRQAFEVLATSKVAQALGGERPRESAVAEALGYLRGDAAAALHVANACCALGALDDMFAILEGYYFDRGEWAKIAPAAGDADRTTQALFLPPMKPAWTDARFGPLLRRIGLEDYWRQSGTMPDFRRA
jgi:hypothetical protein